MTDTKTIETVQERRGMTYRKTMEVSSDREYWYVSMGELDHLNGPAAYPFPTLEAATQFAKNHKARDPHREVLIVFPDGRAWDGARWVTQGSH